MAAIVAADLIVIGPGSVYTSIIPNLLVDDIAAAIRASAAVKIYICNVATEPGETEHYGVQDHIDAIERYVGRGAFDHVIVNSRINLEYSDGPSPSLLRMSESERRSTRMAGTDVVVAEVIDERVPEHHHSERLAKSIMSVYRAANSADSAARIAAIRPN